MMTFRRKDGGLILTARSDIGRCVVQFGADGGLVSYECEVKPPKPIALPRQKMPEDFDMEQEKRRMTQGGCCGQPSE